MAVPAARFVSDLAGNTGDRLFCDAAQMSFYGELANMTIQGH